MREEMASQNVYTHTYVSVHNMFVCTYHLDKHSHTYTGIRDVSILKIKSRGDVYIMHCRAVCSVTDNSVILSLAFQKSLQTKVHVFTTNHRTSIALFLPYFICAKFCLRIQTSIMPGL